MRKPIQLLTAGMFLVLGACTGHPGYHIEEYKEVKFEDLPADVKIPSKAWDLLSFKEPSAGGEAAHGGGEGHSEKKEGEDKKGSSKDIVFSEVTVFLVQKNPDVIKGEAVKIELPRGGGEIDISQYLTGGRGSFYVGFEFPEFKDSTAQKVLFVSQARKRKLGDEIFGAGCNQILDITKKYMLAMKGEGLKVNTTRERYASTLGGLFLFSAQKGDSIHVAQVRFTDSQHPNLFCEGL
ncbi:MAG: hypothetical protein J7501_12975 [Bdellovibrio sp.]|nr:hypothetical protein [Bdellovibrio sp.]